MGCDIHLQLEIRRDGVWTWPLAGTPRYLDADVLLPEPLWALTQRDYRTFTLLAGVRDQGEGIVPIAEPRGLPSDLSPELRAACDEVTEDETSRWWFGDHSYSWLSLAEVLEYGHRWLRTDLTAEETAQRTANALLDRQNPDLAELLDPQVIWLLKHGIRGICETYNRGDGTFGPCEAEDVRLVFGFDS